MLGIMTVAFPITSALLLMRAGVLSSLEMPTPVSYTPLRAHETVLDLVCRLLLEKKNI